MEGDEGTGTGTSLSELAFCKYEGLGNDFVIIETEREDVVSVAMVRRLCDRRLGIGADGVLLLLPPRKSKSGTTTSDGRMLVINADGSIPEMCGNGIRCIALHVARNRGGLREGTLTFDTDAGAKPCTIDDRDGRGLVTVDMGVVRWLEDIRLDLEGGGEGGDTWELALADAGNPHVITRRIPSSRAEIDRIAPRIATHARFPAGTNVELTTIRSPTEIDLVVWERGVGITQACGTGACATVAVAVTKGWSPANTEIAVHLPGGTLYVRIDPSGHAIMRGPARHVFSGRVSPGSETLRRGAA